jgi:Putative enzyme of poly-gamma-glutamate biosynthesis (capsule formation)
MNSINILFTGDFAPCRNFEEIVLDKKEQVLGDALLHIEAADCSFTNLECVLTDHKKIINKSGPALKANPKCIEALKHFSVVGLANNHILDYGKQGLRDTLLACENLGLPTLGSGMDLAQAQKPFIHEVKDTKIAIISHC